METGTACYANGTLHYLLETVTLWYEELNGMVWYEEWNGMVWRMEWYCVKN